MKKTGVSVLTASLCIALSFSAFILPIYADAGLNLGAANVMEKETPKEYMEDFNAEGTQQNIRKYINTIFLSESQLAPLKATAEKTFLETLDVVIPQEMKFDYNTIEHEGVVITINWSDSKDTSENSASFYAEFRTKDLLNEPVVLTTLIAKNGYDAKNIDGLKKQGLESLKTELGITVPEDYFFRTHLIVELVDGQVHNVNTQFTWSEDGIINSYLVMFDKVDLLNNTGKLTGIENTAAINQVGGDEKKAPEFTASQKEELLEEAKRFFAEKRIEVSNLTRSYQIGDVMWFVFEPTNEKDYTRTFVDIKINSSFEVLGYIY